MSIKSDSQGSTKPKLQCQIWLPFGHSAERCWKRFNKNWKIPYAHKDVFALQITDVDTNEWIPDSGASSPMSGNSSLFTYCEGAHTVMVGNGICLPTSHIDTVVLPIVYGSWQLENTLLVPDLKQSHLYYTVISWYASWCLLFHSQCLHKTQSIRIIDCWSTKKAVMSMITLQKNYYSLNFILIFVMFRVIYILIL